MLAKQAKPWADKNARAAITKDFGREIASMARTFFGPLNHQPVVNAARNFLKATIFRGQYSPQSSGFVIAGFGEEEYFPTVIEYNTDGWIGDRVKISSKEPADLSREMQSCIRAFAQGDMVQRFMNGIDGQLHQALLATFMETLSESCLSVLEKYGDVGKKTGTVRAEILTAVNASMKELIINSREYVDEKFSQPVIRMVAVLPKDELAHLAESLVALTSLKRRVSSDAETVGGPVDVALISKGDGFVWVKRKLYFPLPLNPHFAANYMLGNDFGGTDDARP